MNISCRFILNSSPRLKKTNLNSIDQIEMKEAYDFHKSLPIYEPTSLCELKNFSTLIGVKNIYVKDEARRFGLNSFKVMGASYAMHKCLKEKPELTTFCCATDGNHGKAVAWYARFSDKKAIVFVPSNTELYVIRSIKEEGAEVRVCEGNYDETVKEAAIAAQENNWQLLQDTSWDGYTIVPRWIMAGYATIFNEIKNSISLEAIDFLFLGVGVGSWAAAAVKYLYLNCKKIPKIICVEPTEADGLMESVRNGKLSVPLGNQNSIMFGLNCGVPSLIAWPILEESVGLYLAIPDEYVTRARKLMANKNSTINSGPTGAAGLAGLTALFMSPDLIEARNTLSINDQSTILLINTDGDQNLYLNSKKNVP